MRVAGAPQLVQVAGHRAGGADHDVARVGDLVDGADDLRLGRQRLVAEVVRRLRRSRPTRRASCGRPLAVCAASTDQPVERRRPAARRPSRASPTSARRGELVGVERRDVEVDEADVVGGEHGPRRGGEVAVAGADADHEVGLGGERVGGGRAGGADRADRLRVVVGQGALAGLGLGDRDAGGLGERAQRVGGAGSR